MKPERSNLARLVIASQHSQKRLFMGKKEILDEHCPSIQES